MNFSEALEALKQGKSVARAHWGGYWFITEVAIKTPNIVAGMRIDAAPIETMIIAKLKDGGYAPAQPYQGDLLANDWRVVEL